MECPILQATSLEVLIHIQSFMEPSGIVALRKTCKHLASATQQRIVWLEALHRICVSHGLFLPSFPVEHMSQKSLEHAALAPQRFHSMMPKSSEADPPFYSSTRLIDFRFCRSLDYPIQPTFDQVRLIPGGRYLLTRSERLMLLWDLGFNAAVMIRRFPLASMIVKTPYFLGIRPTVDGSGMVLVLPIVLDDQSTSISVYTIYPLHPHPAFLHVATLDNCGIWGGDIVWATSDTRVAFQRSTIITVWNFRDDTIVAWNHQTLDVREIILSDDHVILFRPSGISLHKIPMLYPRNSGRDTKIDHSHSLMDFAYASGPYEDDIFYLVATSWMPKQNTDPFFSIVARNFAGEDIIDYYASVPMDNPNLPTRIPLLTDSLRLPPSADVDEVPIMRLCNGYITQTALKDGRQVLFITSPIPTQTIAGGAEFGTCKVVNLWEPGGESEAISEYSLCPATGRLCIVMTGGHEIRIIDFLTPF